jgi:putative transposase
MPIPIKYNVDFEEGCFYHVYNRTNNKEPLFRSSSNYVYFMQKYHQYLSPFVNLYGWCLLSNHFHLQIRVKTREEIVRNIKKNKEKDLCLTEVNFLTNSITLSELIETVFKRFFQSYAQAFNKKYKRKGNLFHRPFKRIKIEGSDQLIRNLIYIHLNPLKHGIVEDYELYEWSSWNEFKPGAIWTEEKEEILRWFGGYKNFLTMHRVNSQVSTLKS